MHIHILGICGTFMGSLAVIARELGHKVTGRVVPQDVDKRSRRVIRHVYNIWVYSHLPKTHYVM